MGVIRSTFVVDPEGKIEKAHYAVKATGHVEGLGKSWATLVDHHRAGVAKWQTRQV